MDNSNLQFAARVLTYDQLKALMEALSQYCDNQGEHEEMEADIPPSSDAEVEESDRLKACRAILLACELDQQRRLGL